MNALLIADADNREICSRALAFYHYQVSKSDQLCRTGSAEGHADALDISRGGLVEVKALSYFNKQITSSQVKYQQIVLDEAQEKAHCYEQALQRYVDVQHCFCETDYSSIARQKQLKITKTSSISGLRSYKANYKLKRGNRRNC